MRRQRTGHLWVPHWVLRTGVASIITGVVLAIAGVAADEAGWWASRGFAVNLTSGLTSALIGIPVSVLVISVAVDRARTYRATTRLRDRTISTLLRLLDATACAIASDVKDATCPQLSPRLTQVQIILKAERHRDSDGTKPRPVPDLDVDAAIVETLQNTEAAVLNASTISWADKALLDGSRRKLDYLRELQACFDDLHQLHRIERACAAAGIDALPGELTRQLLDEFSRMSAAIRSERWILKRIGARAGAGYLAVTEALDWAAGAGWPIRREGRNPRRYRVARSTPAPKSMLGTGIVMGTAGLFLVVAALRLDGSSAWEHRAFTVNLATSLIGALIGIPLSVLGLSIILERVSEHRVSARLGMATRAVLDELADLSARALARDVTSSRSAKLDQRLTAAARARDELEEAVTRYKGRTSDASKRAWAEHSLHELHAQLEAAQERAAQIQAAHTRDGVELRRLAARCLALGEELRKLQDVADAEGIDLLTKLGLDPILALVNEMGRRDSLMTTFEAATLFEKVQASRAAADGDETVEP